MTSLRKLPVALAFVSALALSACESTEDKADRLYERGRDLAAEGDLPRAFVSLKSVFRLDGEHLEARMLYADLNRDEGKLQEAYRHYLLVTEQHPDFRPARVDLAEVALQVGAWDIVARQAEAARQLGAQGARLDAVEAVLDYRAAREIDDEVAQRRIAAQASRLLARNPELNIARRLVIDDRLDSGQIESALAELDTALQIAPMDKGLNRLKLTLLSQSRDMPGIGEHLRTMVERFPEDRDSRTALVRWYLANDDRDGAEAFVRQLVAEGGDEVGPRIALVQFMRQVRGLDAAIAELDRLIEEGLDPVLFENMRASLVYDQGAREAAIASLEDLQGRTEPSDGRRDMQVTLARMYLGTGRTEAANGLVAEVLEQDPGHVDGLKLRARWLIAEDEVRDAVLALRTALDQNPSDAEALTLLAQAYQRDGNRELVGESLARAYDASNAAPAETLRYANFLMSREKYLTAEEILLRALSLAPRDLALLQSVGEVYLALGDWPRAEQVVAAIRRLESAQADQLATGLQATLLQRMQRSEESLQLLRNVIEQGEGGVEAPAAIIRTHLAEGNVEAARAFLDELIAEADGEQSNGLSFLEAALLTVEGRFDAAERVYRTLLEEDPEQEIVWRALVAAASREGRPERAEALTDEALNHLPTSPTLRWIKAGFLERRGEIDGAIDIYEALYEANSASTIIANNLASLLSTHRADQATLERSYVIARRLRGTRVPAFQDTYGWIAERLGNHQEALMHLEPAAASLPQDPTVQYHLAKAYMSLNRPEDAARQFRAALDLWETSDRGKSQGRPADARAELEKISSAQAAGPN